MKNSIHYTLSLTLLLLMGGYGFADEVSKTYSKEYTVNTGAMLKISNKYGSIECKTWDKNAVKIDVLVTVDHSSTSKAQSILDKIEIDISGNDNLVEANTETGNLNCNNCEIDIKYSVLAPANINLDLLMKYGFLSVDNFTGNSKLGVKYGDMKINRLDGNAEVYLAYGDGYIGKLKIARADIQYSDFEIDEVDEFSVKTQYSDVEINKVYSLKSTTNYDDLQVDEAYSVDCDGNFSGIEIGTLKKDLIVDINYGELEVELVKAGFGKIEIYSNYADAKLDMEEGASFTVEAYMSYSDFNIFDKRNISEYEKTYSSSTFKGYVGNNQGAGSSIYVKMKHAGMYVNQ